MKPSKIQQLHTLLTEKKISAKELCSETLSKAKTAQETTNAFTYIAEEEALKQADHVDTMIANGEELPLLAGIPCSIKDVIATEGMYSTAASNILSGFQPPYSAAVVERLTKEGVVIIGKNNCDEFAMGGANEHSAYGPAKNPHDPSRITGGSSGGSAAAVASDASIFSIGTDTGGSIRQPAALCGCVGLKVTYGRVSRFGAMAMASSFDTIGPLTQTVADAAYILEKIAGKDPRDMTTLSADVPAYSQYLGKDIRGLKIGLPKEYFDGLEGNQKTLLMETIEKLTSLGAEIKEVSLPMTEYALPAYYIIVPAEVSSNMSRYDGLRYGPTQPAESLEELYVSNRTKGFGAEVQRRIILGSFVLSHGYYDAYYKRAQKIRTLIIQDFDRVFQEVDVLATPVAPSTAYPIGSKRDPLSSYLEDIYTIPASCAGIPGLSLPVGTLEGLPVGLQLLAPQLREDLLIQVGSHIETILEA